MLRLRVRPSVSVTQQTAETETAQNADTDHSERGMVAVHGIQRHKRYSCKNNTVTSRDRQIHLDYEKFTIFDKYQAIFLKQ